MTTPKEFRIPKLPREEWTDDAREVMAFWGEPNAWEEGSATNIIMVMAQHPDLANAYNLWGKHLLVTNTVPLRAREIIILRVAWLKQSEYRTPFRPTEIAWQACPAQKSYFGTDCDISAALYPDSGRPEAMPHHPSAWAKSSLAQASALDLRQALTEGR